MYTVSYVCLQFFLGRICYINTILYDRNKQTGNRKHILLLLYNLNDFLLLSHPTFFFYLFLHLSLFCLFFFGSIFKVKISL